MLQLSRWKIIVVVLATIFGFLFTLPNLLPADARAKLPGFLPNKTLNLGLDLQGGSYLLYEVDTATLLRQRLDNLVEDVVVTLQQAQVGSTRPAVVGNEVRVQITDPAQVGKAMDALKDFSRRSATAQGQYGVVRGADNVVRITISQQMIAAEALGAVDQSKEIIDRRINALGTLEPLIVRQGSNRIVVQAPGESDPDKLKRVIGQTAKLTFQMVDESVSWQEAQAGNVPFGSVLLPQPGNQSEPFVLVRKRVLVSGDNLRKATSGTDEYNKPAIHFTFDQKGAKAFADVTMRNRGKRFAIILDDKVISAPTIQSAILQGQGQITGNFTPDSAKELADLLQGGALPAPLKVIQQSVVGAGLGAEAVDAGAKSLLIGAIAIVIFMLLAYGLFGLFAVIGLVVNVLLLIGIMNMNQFAMTLPGIAGIILTLAVAVDANVLIYERMRDEARAGHPPLQAADHGFRRALVSILDANVTSLISGFIMFSAGSGPVKGFALTLMLGVFTSVFSAVLVTQLLIGWWLRVAKPKTLPI
jgi:preprotein translocase subunit SecD